MWSKPNTAVFSFCYERPMQSARRPKLDALKKAMVPMATFMKESRSSVIASQQGCCVWD